MNGKREKAHPRGVGFFIPFCIQFCAFSPSRKKKNPCKCWICKGFLVEVAGFEPTTFWSRTKRATKLRYTSKVEPIKGLEPLT